MKNCNPCRYSFMRIDSRTGIRLVSLSRDHRIMISGHGSDPTALHHAVATLERFGDVIVVSRPTGIETSVILQACDAVENIKMLDRPEQPWKIRRNQRKPF